MNEFYITLVSNASADKVNNSLTQFRNILPEAINLRHSWEIALHSIYMHNHFQNNLVQYVRVNCDIVKQDLNEDQCIAILSRPPETNHITKPLYLETTQHKYYQLNKTFISEIKIRLEFNSAQNETLDLKTLLPGQPTVVKLHFRRTKMSSPICVLHVESKGETNPLRQLNKAAKFSIEYGQPINFGDVRTVEVAMAGITYQPIWEFSGKEHLTIKMYDPQTKQEIWETSFEPYDKSDFNIAQYTSYLRTKVFNKFKNGPNSPTVLVRKGFNDTTYSLMCDQTIEIGIPYSLAFNMGERKFNTLDPESNFFRIKLAPAQQTLNMTDRLQHYMEVPPDPLAYYPEMGFLYCDFINYNILGEISAPIIKAFPLSTRGKNSNYITYTPQTLEYYPISKYDLSTMSFELRDVSGNFLPFKFQDNNIIITIMIRRRQQ